MALKQFQTQLVQNDSRTFAMEVTKDGVLQNLNGYTVTLTAVLTPPAGAKTTMTASVTAATDITRVLVDLLGSQTTVPGLYDAVLTASKSGGDGPWSALGSIEVVARPA